MTERPLAPTEGAPPRRPRRWVRYVAVIVGLVVIVAVLGGLKFAQISMLMAYGEDMAKLGPPPEVVGSTVATHDAWETTLSAVGSVAGGESVEVSNDAPGIVSRIRFKSGDVVERGRILVELDASPERAQLASARSRLALARVTAERTRALVKTAAVAREQLDRDQSAFDSARAEVAELEAQIARKTVRAPFDGRLGIRAVNLGQYLTPGTTIATLDALEQLYVDFALPQEQLASLRTGLAVRIELQGSPGALEGRLAAIAPTVDRATRSVKLRATVPAAGGHLRAGMFVRASVVLPERASVLIVPATAIVHAAYGDSVFVVEPKPPEAPGMTTTRDGKPVRIARQQFVRVGASRGDFVVISEGVKAGDEIVSAGAFKLRNGSPVVVDNTRVVEPQLDPRPPNR